jgi:hypothetical protein
VLRSGEKLTSSLLASITLEIAPFRVYALFLVLLPVLKCSVEEVFCEGGEKESVQQPVLFSPKFGANS